MTHSRNDVLNTSTRTSRPSFRPLSVPRRSVLLLGSTGVESPLRPRVPFGLPPTRDTPTPEASKVGFETTTRIPWRPFSSTSDAPCHSGCPWTPHETGRDDLPELTAGCRRTSKVRFNEKVVGGSTGSTGFCSVVQVGHDWTRGAWRNTHKLLLSF